MAEAKRILRAELKATGYKNIKMEAIEAYKCKKQGQNHNDSAPKFVAHLWHERVKNGRKSSQDMKSRFQKSERFQCFVTSYEKI